MTAEVVTSSWRFCGAVVIVASNLTTRLIPLFMGPETISFGVPLQSGWLGGMFKEPEPSTLRFCRLVRLLDLFTQIQSIFASPGPVLASVIWYVNVSPLLIMVEPIYGMPLTEIIL